jgi:branched-chain amino acid transport system ATP-binding protein
MGVSDRITVLNFGRCIASGSKAEVQENEHVIEAYLGSGRYQARDSGPSALNASEGAPDVGS